MLSVSALTRCVQVQHWVSVSRRPGLCQALDHRKCAGKAQKTNKQNTILKCTSYTQHKDRFKISRGLMCNLHRMSHSCSSSWSFLTKYTAAYCQMRSNISVKIQMKETENLPCQRLFQLWLTSDLKWRSVVHIWPASHLFPVCKLHFVIPETLGSLCLHFKKKNVSFNPCPDKLVLDPLVVFVLFQYLFDLMSRQNGFLFYFIMYCCRKFEYKGHFVWIWQYYGRWLEQL